jgi:hypothetical protein
MKQYYFELFDGASAEFAPVTGVNTGALSVRATQTWPGAKRISSPVGNVHEVPD